MRNLLILIICVTFVFTPLLVKAQLSEEVPLHQYYDPARPKNAKLYYGTGILKDYSAGTSSSSICIRLSGNKEQCFFATITLRLNGVINDCEDFGTCKNMPKDFVFGKTRVKVTYWYTKGLDGITLTEVTDQVDSVK